MRASINTLCNTSLYTSCRQLPLRLRENTHCSLVILLIKPYTPVLSHSRNTFIHKRQALIHSKTSSPSTLSLWAHRGSSTRIVKIEGPRYTNVASTLLVSLPLSLLVFHALNEAQWKTESSLQRRMPVILAVNVHLYSYRKRFLMHCTTKTSFFDIEVHPSPLRATFTTKCGCSLRCVLEC